MSNIPTTYPDLVHPKNITANIIPVKIDLPSPEAEVILIQPVEIQSSNQDNVNNDIERQMIVANRIEDIQLNSRNSNSYQINNNAFVIFDYVKARNTFIFLFCFIIFFVIYEAILNY